MTKTTGISDAMELLAGDLDTILMFPGKSLVDKGFITGRARYIRPLNFLRIHVWIDPRIESYTFTSTVHGNVPIMRFDTEFSAELLSETNSADEILEMIYNAFKQDLDDAEKNGLPGIDIAPGTNNG